MSKKEIYVVTKTIHRSADVISSADLFFNREEADKYAECCFENEKKNYDSSGRILFGDWYELYNEGNNDRCEINIFKRN